MTQLTNWLISQNRLPRVPLDATFWDRRYAVLLTAGITAFYAACDFTVPGEIAVAIFYASSVAASGWTRSRAFLWGTTLLCIVLTYAGLTFGPKPTTPVLAELYINRSFVAASLVLIAAIVQHRMTILDRVERARDLEIRQNKALTDTETELRRLNEDLEHRVEQEVARRLETERMLHQAQKMEAIGQLAGGLAHDFNNILTTVICNIERILDCRRTEDPGRRFAEAALRGAEQGSRLVKHLLGFARQQPLEPEVVDAGDVVDAVLTLARPAVHRAIELSTKVEPKLWPCRIDQTELESALLNLVINAQDAMPNGGLITISAENTSLETGAADLDRGDYVHLSVKDTGTGMNPEVLGRVWEPFFTTKAIGKGSGLGLPMVYGFARQSGGAARIESAPGRGTAVHLYLPRTTV